MECENHQRSLSLWQVVVIGVAYMAQLRYSIHLGLFQE